MAAFEDLIAELERSYREVQERMSDPAVYNDHREAAEVGRRLKELEGPYKLAQEWRATQADLAAARDDSELRELVADLEQRLVQIEEELRLALVERDPADAKDVILEVRQGVGGDEAALWAGEVTRMLSRYADRRGFKVEELGTSANESGGVKEAVIAIKGDGAYSVYKWEGGTHRVQRVPETESQGRIHTSTATVAVMPEAEEVEVEIDPNDLKIDVYRSTGPGGQRVNTTDSAVRITHLPTGIVVAMQDEKSQLQNRAKALRVLRARLFEAERARQQAAHSAQRNSQIGTGERAEKIRTYNFAENRVTDHRIKLTVHQLDRILQGELDEFTDALTAEERRRALETPRRDCTLAPDGRCRAAASPRYLAARESTARALDAERLLGKALGLSRLDLYLHHDRPLDPAERDAVRELVAGAASASRSRTCSATGASAGSSWRPTGARSCRGRRPRSSSSAASSCSRARRAARARRRHRHRRDRARDRRRAPGRARHRARPLEGGARPGAREPRADRRRDRDRRGRRDRVAPGGAVGPRRLEPAVRRRA